MPSIHDDIEWDLGRSDYVPQEYTRPWDREGWGGSDVAVTPPREGAWKPNKPGFQQGQRDYQYMATEKEQRRERARELADQARKEGVDWRERQLPRKEEEEATIQPVYGDWREAEMPRGGPAEVIIQPINRKEKEKWEREQSGHEPEFNPPSGWTGKRSDQVIPEGADPNTLYSRNPPRRRGVNTSPTQNLGRDLMMAIFRRR